MLMHWPVENQDASAAVRYSAVWGQAHVCLRITPVSRHTRDVGAIEYAPRRLITAGALNAITAINVMASGAGQRRSNQNATKDIHGGQRCHARPRVVYTPSPR